MKYVLASTSPRRKQLMKKVVDDFVIVEPNAPEHDLPSSPRDTVLANARAKAISVASDYADSVVIGADTIVVLDGEILGKPKNADDAKDMLGKLSARRHQVYSGVCMILNGHMDTFYDISTVEFFRLLPSAIDDYIASGSPFDKAGGYGVQDSGFVSNIIGSYFNVMGLPVELLRDHIAKITEEEDV